MFNLGSGPWSSQPRLLGPGRAQPKLNMVSPNFGWKNFAAQNFWKNFAIAKFLPNFRIAKIGAYHVQFWPRSSGLSRARQAWPWPSGLGSGQIEHGKLQFLRKKFSWRKIFCFSIFAFGKNWAKFGAYHVQFGPGPGPRSQGCSGLVGPFAQNWTW